MISDGLKRAGQVFDQLADFIGVAGGIPQFIKTFRSMFGRKKEKPAETEHRPEETPTPDVHLGGHFTYADETGFAKLLAELATKNGYRKAPMEITTWIEASLEKDDQRRFRVIMSSVGKLTVEKAGEILKKSTLKKIFTKKGLPPNVEEETKEERELLKENFGIEFLKVFYRATSLEKKALCQAIGVFDTPWDELEQMYKSVSKFIKKHDKKIAGQIDATTRWLRRNTGGRYRGFWSAAFPVNRNAGARRAGRIGGIVYVLRRYRGAILSGSFAGAVIIMLLVGIIFS